MECNFMIFLIIIVILLFLIWVFKEIRDICKNFEGFIKFTQITFMLFSWIIFTSIFGFYLFYNPNEKVSILNIFLTIIVGFLGTMIGLFFSNEALNELKRKLKTREITLHTNKQKLIEFKNSLIEGLKK